MKSIIRFVEQTKKNFEKGTKLEKFMPLFESFETFLMVPGNVTKKGSHIRDAVDLKRVMSTVIISLIPALLFGIWNTGHFHFMALGVEATFIEKFIQGAIVVLPIIAVSYIAGLGVEFIFVYLKGHEISEGFLVTGLLIPLIMPASIPLWMVA
ncbi:MAG: RnfABCDGE type electron transport complex subunit D, partial [Bacteroidales bacterium]